MTERLSREREKFITKVEKKQDGCWIWKGAINKSTGYGQSTSGGKSILAHRHSFLLFNKSIGPQKCVCHTCDVRACVNPSHLWEGTYSENVLDCKNKGRLHPKRGVENRISKLKDSDIRWIRNHAKLHSMTQRQMAKSLNVSQSAIAQIAVGKNWRHVMPTGSTTGGK